MRRVSAASRFASRGQAGPESGLPGALGATFIWMTRIAGPHCLGSGFADV